MVAEHIEAEHVEASAGRLHELYEHAPFGYLSTTPDGRIVKVNSTLLALTGYSRAELLGRRAIELLSVGSQLFYETRYVPVLQLEGSVREVSLSFVRSDGSELPVLVNSTLVRDGDGEHTVTRTAVFEATGRANYERQLLAARRDAETSEIRVRILQNASLEFGPATTEKALAESLVEVARDAFAASEVAVLFPGPDGRLDLIAGRHPLAHAFSNSTQLSMIGGTDIVTMTDYSEFEERYPGYRQSLADARVASLAVTPILGDDGPLGVYVCFFGRRREFDEPMLEVQAAIARQAALVLQRVRLSEELQRLALYDQLTGLASRRLLHERLTAAIAAARRSRRPLAVIFVDLDGFKAINDSLGHAAGDAVLIEVAERMRAVLRESDVIGRFGGDEFVAICENTDVAATLSVTERLREQISLPLAGAASEFPISASVGVAVYRTATATEMSSDRLFEAADTAMYRSKGDGKNRVTLVEV